MIDWPHSLVEELAARRGIVFMGAGCSAGASRMSGGVRETPPDWKKLLEGLLGIANRGSPDDRTHAQKLIEESRFLDAAEILRSCVQEADYSRFIKHTFKDFQHTELHESINSLDQKVVITTNYDCIYENYCTQGDARDGYVVVQYYDEGLVAKLRSPTRLVVKAHGCMKNAERSILTKSDYFMARQRYGGFFQVLESLFLTNTLLFVGYSLSDPDIQLILESSSITAQSAHPHYAVMPRGTHPSIKAAFKKTYNVELLEYSPDDNHRELTESLKELAAATNDERLA